MIVFSGPAAPERAEKNNRDIAMQSSRRMNLHYSANSALRRRAREGPGNRYERAGRGRPPTRGRGVGPRHRRGRARLATPRCSPGSAFFRYRLLRRSRVSDPRNGASRIGPPPPPPLEKRANAWEHAPSSSTIDRSGAFLRAFPHVGINARKLAWMLRSGHVDTRS